MLRLVITIGLLLSFLTLAKGISVTWHATGWEPPQPEKARAARSLPSRKRIRFYPPVPATTPDLNQGYLFNAARSLASEEAGPGRGENVEANVNITDVTFSGSIITKAKKIAILAFPAQRPAAGRSRLARKVTVRTRPRTMTAGSRLRHVRVQEGDTFSGYTVAEIRPDMVLLRRGEEKIEKYLYDPAKKRIAVRPPTATTRRTVSRPQTRPARRLVPPVRQVGKPAPAGRNVPIHRPAQTTKRLQGSR